MFEIIHKMDVVEEQELDERLGHTVVIVSCSQFLS